MASRVNGILAEVSIILLTLIALAISIYAIGIRRYQPNRFTQISLFTVSTFYFVTLLDARWQYKMFAAIPSLSFFRLADPLLLLFAIGTAFFIASFFKKNNPSVGESILIPERPFKVGTDEDKLSYNEKTERLVKELLTIDLQQCAFVAGIVGQWGSGKTVMIRQMKHQLKKSNCLVIEFTPWKYGSKANYQQRYFEQLSDELSVYDGNISRTIHDYFRKLSGIDKSGTTEFLSGISSVGDVTIESNAIEEVLRRINRRMVVIIDDLDRLQASELLEIFKLVRLTAFFKYTIFILSYDKEYLTNALESFKFSGTYLEKIIDFEYYLPPPDSKLIEDYFIQHVSIGNRHNSVADKLRHILEKYKKDTTIFKSLPSGQMETEVLPFLKETFFSKHIRSLRDARRLANSIRFTLFSDNRVDLVVIEDVLLLEIIKLKYSDAYNKLKEKTWLTPDMNNGKEYYKLNHEFSLKGITAYKDLVVELFAKPPRPVQSIINTDYFELYFDLTINSISPKEYIDFRTKEYQDGIRLVDLWLKHTQKLNHIIDWLIQTEHYASAKEFERMMRYLIYIYNNTEFLIEIQQKLLHRNLIQIADRYYHDAPELLYTFIDNLLIGELDFSKSWIIGWLIQIAENNENIFYINASKLQRIALDRLTNYLALIGHDDISIIQFTLLVSCYNACYASSAMHNIDPRANHLMYNFITSHKHFIYNKLFVGLDGTSSLLPKHAYSIFEGIQNIIRFLSERTFQSWEAVFALSIIEDRKDPNIDGSYSSECIEFNSGQKERIFDLPSMSLLSDAPEHLPTHFQEKLFKISELTNSFWATHKAKLSPQEQLNGGEYLFERRLIFPNTEAITTAKIWLMADDYFKMKINGVLHDTDYVRGTESVFTCDILPYLIAGENVFRFYIKNSPAEEVEQHIGNLNNPYGLIYTIRISLREGELTKII